VVLDVSGIHESPVALWQFVTPVHKRHSPPAVRNICDIVKINVLEFTIHFFQIHYPGETAIHRVPESVHLEIVAVVWRVPIERPGAVKISHGTVCQKI
jgi:hypothetical protein